MKKLKTIDEIQNEIVEEFSVFDDWMDKYTYLIELGNELSELDEKLRNEKTLIKGCQSRVWLHVEHKDNGLITLHVDSDALIVKGIVALLVRIFSDRTPKEILNANTDFITRIGLDQHLSPTRSNGLLAMLKHIKFHALVFSQSNNKRMKHG